MNPRFIGFGASRINAAGRRPHGHFPRGVDLRGVYLRGCELTAPSSIHAGERPTKWDHANLESFYGMHSNYFGVSAKEVYAPRAELWSAIIIGANFEGADLSGANFIASNIEESNFSRAILTGANFSATKARATDFAGARLLKTNFRGASLSHANLKGADHDGADFTHARNVPDEVLSARAASGK